MCILPRIGVLVALVLTTCVVGTADLSTASAEDGATYDALDDWVRDDLAAHDVPGAAWAVVGPEGVRHVGTDGVDGDGEPTGQSTAFLWGSVSKPVAATVVLDLAADGLLDLDAPVSTYVDAFRDPHDPAASRITVRQALEQTSGLPAGLGLTDVDSPDRTATAVAAEVAQVDLVDDPGHAHHYSSLNYLLLAAVVESATGEPYADVLRDRLLAPLGMDDVVTTDDGAAERLPPGHRYVAGRPVAVAPPYDPAGLAYGYLAGSVDDLGAFAAAQLGGSPAVVGAPEVAALQRPRVETPGGGEYGFGWRVARLSDLGGGTDDEVVWHAGAAPGYQAAVVLVPSRDEAVVVVQNAYGPFQDEELLSTAVGGTTVLAGGDPPTHTSTTWSYPATLGGLGLVLALLLLASGTGVRRLVRAPVRQSRRRRVAGFVGWLLVGSGVIVVATLALPDLLGVPLGRVVLWAPDVAGLLLGCVGAAVLLLAVRTTVLLRSA